MPQVSKGSRMMKRFVVVAAALAVVAGAAGCSGARPVAEMSAPPQKQADSASAVLTTRYPVMVVEREDVRLCVGGMLGLYPPGCMGDVGLIGWDWAAVPGTYEEDMDVRWGEYVVTGTYDVAANELTVVSVDARAEEPIVEESPMGPPMPTACPEPDGGWRIIDESTANQEALGAVGSVATTLDGYATMWIDGTPLPPVPEDSDPLAQMQHYALNAGLNIVTVAVRGDTAAAERQLREVWGGALCVIAVDYTEAERQAIQQEVMDEYMTRGFLLAGLDAVTGVIDITVVHDIDGEMQREVDERYGPGLIRVHSALVPV